MSRIHKYLRAPALIAVAAVLAACGGSSDKTADKPTGHAASEATTYVAVGASETAGYGAADPKTEAWPTVLHGTALPTARYVNLGIPGATAAEAVAKELDAAVAAKPTVASVWLNVNDLVRQVPPSAYEYSLTRLVRALRRGGDTTVLVANTPPLDRMPAYLACRPSPPADAPPCAAPVAMPEPGVINSAVLEYNAAIERVVRSEGAVLVDLHSGVMQARSTGDEAAFFGADGFHPSTIGHRAVAQIFATALHSTEGR